MSHQTGTIQSFDEARGRGYLSCNGTSDGPILFRIRQIDGLKSLTAGEPVSYELIQGSKQVHAEHIQRTAGDLEAYRDFGGLYS